MKPALPLITGTVLIITPQIIAGVVTANTAWVASTYLHAVSRVEASGVGSTSRIEMGDLPGMPLWLMLTSTILGVALCIIGVAAMWKSQGGPTEPSPAPSGSATHAP